MGKNYYDILGVPKDADEDAIKKAYRKMALKYHPDRNPDNAESAKKKFQDVSEAFEVLSDKNKRAIFDQFGEEGLKGAPPPSADGAHAFSGFNNGGTTFTFTSNMPGGAGGFRPSAPEDIFRSFFANMGGGGMGGMDDDMAGFGNIFGSMGGMGGVGGMPGMSGMGGMGGMPRMGGMSGGGRSGKGRGDSNAKKTITRDLPVSLEDLYNGITKKLKVTRKVYDVTGSTIPREKILTIDVKPGWKAGTKIKFQNEGDEMPHGENQDLEFVISQKPHSTFQREGDDLICNLNITLAEALTGFEKSITSLGNRQIPIARKSVTQPGEEIRIPNEGMPISKMPGKKGNLVVRCQVRFPNQITRQQALEIKRILGGV